MNTVNQFQSHQSVRITDKEYERFGQVGTYVGPGDEPGEVTIKFEADAGAGQFAPQVVDTFPASAVEGF